MSNLAAAMIYLSAGFFFSFNFVDWERQHCPEPHVTTAEATIVAVFWAPMFLGAFLSIPFHSGPKVCTK